MHLLTSLHILVISSLLCHPSWADSSHSSAYVSFSNKDFSAAEQAFKKVLLNSPDSPSINYNLGNSLFQQQKYGEAIAFYRRAIALKPSFKEARYNLELAREQVDSDFSSYNSGGSSLLSNFDFVSGKAFRLILLVSYSLFWLSLLVGRSNTLGRALSPLRSIFLLCSLFSSISVFATTRNHQGHLVFKNPLSASKMPAVVLQDNFYLHSSADPASPSIVKLKSGEELLVEPTANNGDWLKFELPDNRFGWGKQVGVLVIPH